MILSGFCQAINKPNQTQFYLAPSTAGGHCWGLKKQTQFIKEQNYVKPYLKGYYGTMPPAGQRENKPNSKPILKAVEWANSARDDC